jgi:hypothetical protein
MSSTIAMTNGNGAIFGAGADARQAQRPGVPMEKEPPEPAGNAHWLQPDEMENPGWVLKRAGLEKLTPVFGTSVPPRGLSGIMRTAAYKIPEHFTSHWLLLMAADRVDVVEDRIKRYLPFAVVAAGLGGVYLALRPRPTFLRRVREAL